MFGRFLYPLRWYLAVFLPLFPHSFSACGSGCEATEKHNGQTANQVQSICSKFAPLNKENISTFCPLNTPRQVHHVMPGYRRQNHPASGQPPPKYQQPHRPKICRHTTRLKNSHDPLLRHHQPHLFQSQVAKYLSGVPPHRQNILPQSIDVYPLSPGHSLVKLQCVAGVADSRSSLSLPPIVKDLALICYQNIAYQVFNTICVP